MKRRHGDLSLLGQGDQPCRWIECGGIGGVSLGLSPGRRTARPGPRLLQQAGRRPLRDHAVGGRARGPVRQAASTIMSASRERTAIRSSPDRRSRLTRSRASRRRLPNATWRFSSNGTASERRSSTGRWARCGRRRSWWRWDGRTGPGAVQLARHDRGGGAAGARRRRDRRTWRAWCRRASLDSGAGCRRSPAVSCCPASSAQPSSA